MQLQLHVIIHNYIYVMYYAIIYIYIYHIRLNNYGIRCRFSRTHQLLPSLQLQVTTTCTSRRGTRLKSLWWLGMVPLVNSHQSPFMGKSTISMANFNSKLWVITRPGNWFFSEMSIFLRSPKEIFHMVGWLDKYMFFSIGFPLSQRRARSYRRSATVSLDWRRPRWIRHGTTGSEQGRWPKFRGRWGMGMDISLSLYTYT